MKKVIQFNLSPLEAIWLASGHTLAHSIVARNTTVARETLDQVGHLRDAIKETYPGGMEAFVTRLNVQIALIYGIKPCEDCGRFHEQQSGDLDAATLIQESLP